MSRSNTGELEPRATIGTPGYPDLPVMRFGNLFHDVQSETRPVGFRGKARLEDLVSIIFRDTRAVVFEEETSRQISDGDCDASATVFDNPLSQGAGPVL